MSDQISHGLIKPIYFSYLTSFGFYTNAHSSPPTLSTSKFQISLHLSISSNLISLFTSFLHRTSHHPRLPLFGALTFNYISLFCPNTKFLSLSHSQSINLPLSLTKFVTSSLSDNSISSTHFITPSKL